LTTVGTANYEWVVSLPTYVAEELKKEFGDKIIIGLATYLAFIFAKREAKRWSKGNFSVHRWILPLQK